MKQEMNKELEGREAEVLKGEFEGKSEEELTLEKLVEKMKSATEDEFLNMIDTKNDVIDRILDSEEQEIKEEIEAEGQQKEADVEVGENNEQSEEGQEVHKEEGQTESEFNEKEIVLSDKALSNKESLIQRITKEISRDPILKQLSLLSEEDRIAWALENGNEGLIKLMQLQKLETAMMIEEAKKEALKGSLDDTIDYFMKRNEDLLKNPEYRELAQALELKYLRELGVSSYEDLTPNEYAKVLRKVEVRLRKLAGQSETQEKNTDNGVNQESSTRAGISVGDINGGQGMRDNDGIGLLKTLAQDPLKLESALDRLPKNMIDSLLAELE